MKRAKATDVKNRFGEFIQRAQVEPITVEKTGRPSVVILAFEEYQRLMEIENLYWCIKADEAEKEGFIGSEASQAFIQTRLNED